MRSIMSKSKISRQYSFINNQHGFTISLIEGHQLLEELGQIHNIGPIAADFYKKTVLSSLQLINFLKPGENLGFYIDSDEPYYRFKIEISHNGSLRTLLLPEEFDNPPTKLTGKCRIHKIYSNREPYTSILEFTDHPVEELVNEVMDKSYQTKSHILVSEDCSSTLMITKLPPSNIDKKIEDFDDLTIEQIQEKFSDLINAALLIPELDVAQAEELFSHQGLNYIGSKEVKFSCPCSRERMVENFFTLSKADRTEIFQNQSKVEIRCDYCNTIYEIKKDEVMQDLH